MGCIIISCMVYIIYNIVTLCIFGIPNSLSETYYLYKNKWNIGWVFPIMIYLVVGLLLPGWIILSEGMTLQFLAFLSPASLLFVGTAPAFKKSKLEDNVHTISAYIATICSLLWIVFATPYWWIILIWTFMILSISIFTKTVTYAKIYWIELITMNSTFSVLLLCL